ncbi:hypothetical protein KGF56_004619 [Candida oxycetoniae]|uniref:Uncharacterized protein n=1 Tax=Candida oxycetoniae TaxID=497107 RepID=A0AAI9WVZ5_9ASCO|nr:uncharacterized protein KGF56_004619 [Candida oxycetoniae]KAI3402527.2 hypothetical protein KGF56_004619 [Candida oxycetoniae]
MSVFVAKIKNVSSGDTVVAIPTKSAQIPPPERIITLSYVKPIDEFESKEYLRQLLLGKVIKFKVFNKAANREFGDIQAPIFNSLIEYLLTNGYVKVKENLPDDEEVEKLRHIEQTAKAKNVGLWAAKKSKTTQIVPLTEEIILASQRKPMKLIVDKVISGDRIVGNIYVNKNSVVAQTPLLLAGVKSPRTDATEQPQNLTKVAKEAKYFVEQNLLTRDELEVTIIGENQSGLPIALIKDISERVLESGYGEIVDWQSSLIGSSTMSKLRKAEQTARALGKGIFANAKSTSIKVNTSSSLAPGKKVNVTVAKIISADTLTVRLPGGSGDVEATVQLASVRGPKPNDTTVVTDSAKQQALVATAKEFVRAQTIGKQGTLYVDGYREENKDLNLPARFLVSLKLGNTDISELLVSSGFATVIKHNKATQNERSMNWDKLIELEEEAKKSKRGMYGDLKKVLTVGTRIIDASENLTKAKTFLNGFKQKGRITGYYVEFVPNATRVKLFNPKDGMKLTLILSGLSNEKSDASTEGTDFLNRKYLQRPVEFEIFGTDKLGSFIGNLFANANALVPVQVQLLQQGLVKIHDFAINSNPQASAMIQAEDQAKEEKKGLWKNYDAAEAESQLAASSNTATNTNTTATTTTTTTTTNTSTVKPKFFDIEVVGIELPGVISFHMADSKTKQIFTSFKQQFQQFHSQQPSASKLSQDLPVNYDKAPKKNELVSAKFSEDGKYYRAKFLGLDKATNKYQVIHLDYGNKDKVPLSSLRYLPSKFNLAAYPQFAHTATLQNLKLPPGYLEDAICALEDLTYDKKLVISALPGQDAEYNGVLYDAEISLKDASYTINKELVREGLAVVDDKNVAPNVKDYVEELLRVQKQVKANHVGCWEFGDVAFEDESLLTMG